MSMTPNFWPTAQSMYSVTPSTYQVSLPPRKSLAVAYHPGIVWLDRRVNHVWLGKKLRAKVESVLAEEVDSRVGCLTDRG